jgi:Cas3, HD domain
MDDALLIRRYWGKAKPKMSSGPQWHSLVYHSLDVAACGRKLLEADTERRRGLARLSGLDEGALLAWLSFLLVTHDLGKFSDGFQNLRPDLLQALQERGTRANYDERHDTLGWLFAQDYLPSAFATDDTEVFPTHVGMNRPRGKALPPSPSVPHACGDEPCLSRRCCRVYVCAPRMWG